MGGDQFFYPRMVSSGADSKAGIISKMESSPACSQLLQDFSSTAYALPRQPLDVNYENSKIANSAGGNSGGNAAAGGNSAGNSGGNAAAGGNSGAGNSPTSSGSSSQSMFSMALLWLASAGVSLQAML